jgi:hypothetical protein
MTQHPQPQPPALCPHLAAAVLWMSKTTRSTRRGKPRIRYARAVSPPVDDLLAL